MIGKVLDNRYELVEFVGKGGMALVYRAVDRRNHAGQRYHPVCAGGTPGDGDLRNGRCLPGHGRQPATRRNTMNPSVSLIS